MFAASSLLIQTSQWMVPALLGAYTSEYAVATGLCTIWAISPHIRNQPGNKIFLTQCIAISVYCGMQVAILTCMIFKKYFVFTLVGSLLSDVCAAKNIIALLTDSNTPINQKKCITAATISHLFLRYGALLGAPHIALIGFLATRTVCAYYAFQDKPNLVHALALTLLAPI